MKGVPRLESLEVLSVGFPFCVFKIAAGAAFRARGGLWTFMGEALIALGAVDLIFNAANFAGLVLIRRRVLDACFLSFAARSVSGTARKSRWTLQDFGNSLDVLISFSLVAYMIGAGRLKELSPFSSSYWNAAVVLNVLGAGLMRFTESVRNLTEEAEPGP